MVDVRLETVGAWPAAFVRSGGDWISLHSRRDPVAEADRMLAQHFPDTLPLTIAVAGLGLGFLLDALERRHFTGRVIAAEPLPTLADAMQQRRVAQTWMSEGRLSLLVGPAFAGREDLWKAFGDAPADPRVLVHPVLARACPTESDAARAVVERAAFAAKANAEAKRENAGRYLLNTLRNAPAIAAGRNAMALDGALPGVPALLVAAGPSLDRNLQDIVRFQDRALLVAVDTALRPLLAAGVEPDLVVAVDPTESNARHLTDLPPCPRSYFVAEGSLDPEALSAFEGRTFFFRVGDHHPWPWLREHGLDCGRLRAWGSVLTTAFDLALSAGCDPIVFAGADLAFTGRHPYARGTTYEEDWRRQQAWGTTLEEIWRAQIEQWPLVDAPGVGGVLVPTAPHLRSFRDWIATEALRAAPRRIINATGGGILSGEGLQQGTLEGVFGSAPILTPGPRDTIAACRATDVPALMGDLRSALDAQPAVMRAWLDFAPGVSARDVVAALTTPEPGGDTAPASPPATPRGTPPPAERDARLVDDLSRQGRVHLVELLSPDMDVDAALRDAIAQLDDESTVVLRDALGESCRARAQRAVYAALCVNDDLWLEERRFVDPDSALMLLRCGALRRLASPESADAPKFGPEQQAIANQLVPVIASALRPASVTDFGCGAGYWLDAFSRAGVSRVAGVTPARDGDLLPSVAGCIERRPLGAPSPAAPRADVAICLEVVQRLGSRERRALIEACAAAADTVVFSSTPPGVPGASPGDRPFEYWAALFLDHGFVLDDALRMRLEERASTPRTVYEGLVVFRRAWTPGIDDPSPAIRAAFLASAYRVADLFMRNVWWYVALKQRQAPSRQPAPTSPLVAIPIDRARWLSDGHGLRRFRFRTDTARWFVTHPSATIDVLEDGRALPSVKSPADLIAAPHGGWHWWRDEILVTASDHSDPRTNGRQYSVVLPEHVARAEQQPSLESSGRADAEARDAGR